MKIVDGFNEAKKLLDQQAPKDLEYKQETESGRSLMMSASLGLKPSLN